AGAHVVAHPERVRATQHARGAVGIEDEGRDEVRGLGRVRAAVLVAAFVGREALGDAVADVLAHDAAGGAMQREVDVLAVDDRVGGGVDGAEPAVAAAERAPAGVESFDQLAPESIDFQTSPFALSTEAYTVPGCEREKAISARAVLLRPEGVGTSAAVFVQLAPPSRENAMVPSSRPATALAGLL